MHTKEGTPIPICRLTPMDIPAMYELMLDVVSRIPSQELFAMDDEAYFLSHMEEHGEIYGAYVDGRLAAYSVLAFPGQSASNLGTELGVPSDELNRVAVLDSTVVHESVRGVGLQKLFHELREKRARERGFQYLYSTVHPDNLASIRNIEAAGLTKQFTCPMYGDKMRHCYAKRLGNR